MQSRTLDILRPLWLLAVVVAWQGRAGQLSALPPTTRPTITEKIPGTPVSFELVELPAGLVEMPALQEGGPPQIVRIKPIWIGRTELTWEAYDIWLLRQDLSEEQRLRGAEAEARPSAPYVVPDHGFGHEGFAAIGIHPHAAQLFCVWLSAKTGKKYRLPTEAEWEYACRAGGPERPERGTLNEIAWFADNAIDERGDLVAHAAADRRPNAWGLYDMLGNVREWTMAADGPLVVKGGSFKDKAKDLNARARWFFDAAWQFSDPEEPKSKWWLRDGPHIGFRVVRED